MRTFAFTFGAPYDLHDAIVLVEADCAEDAIAQFVEHRKGAGGVDNPEFRWSTVAPYEGSVKALFDLQGYRIVDPDTPIHFRNRHD